MSKKKSIIVLSLVAVFIILMAVFAVVDFPIGNTVYDYHGYAKTIKLGLDMNKLHLFDKDTEQVILH